jgi:plastocyanin
MNIRLIVPAIAAGALVLAACGGGDSESDGTTAPVDADVVVRAVDPLEWDQETYTAASGDIVLSVQNDSGQPHNLRIIDPADVVLPLNLDIPSKGDVETGTVTLTAGDYTLVCTIPGHTNMRSTLTVS